MENLITQSIGQIVAEDYRTAAVFQKYGIDFCCKGGRTINEACDKKNISSDKLLSELDEVSSQSTDQNADYKNWKLDLLADHIQNKHHKYIEETTPVLQQFLDKLCKVHGTNHPELFEIKEEFNASAGELAMHMKKEELILFPVIRKMALPKYDPEKIDNGIESVVSPISMMMEEHNVEGERFRKIATLSNNYTPPDDGCTTYRVAFKMLKEFEEDLHIHIHLENNILFPESIELEKKLVG